MAGSEYRHELESDIAPFKGIFLGVFFITVGASIDFALLGDNLALVAGMTAGLIALKCAVLLILGRIFKLTGCDKWLFGLGLAQAGEFGFVLLSFTVANAVIPAAVADLLLLVVALSMLLTPLLFILYDKVVAPRYSAGQEPSADEIDPHGSVIIAGHGRFGGIVNRILRGAGYGTTVVDYSQEQLEMLRRWGFKVYFGDATRADLLEAAGIRAARMLVIAIDDKDAVTEMTRYATQHFPDLHIVARAFDRNHVYDLWSVGCRDIIRETYDSSLRTARSALEALGHDRPTAEQMVQEFDTMDRKIMVQVADLWDINLSAEENRPYMEKAMELRSLWEDQLNARMRSVGSAAPDQAERADVS